MSGEGGTDHWRATNLLENRITTSITPPTYF